MNVAITGAAGMLGTVLVDRLSVNHNVFATGLGVGFVSENIYWSCFDITNKYLLYTWLSKCKPDVIIHCAAIVNVDFCELNNEDAFNLHVETTKTIAEYVDINSVYMIYISTDQVFDGFKKSAYFETDKTNPLNIYSKTKLEGESYVLGLDSGLVLRTNIVGWGFGKRVTFVEWLLRGLILEDDLALFNDVLFSPLNVVTLSEIIDVVISCRLLGLYNATSNEGISKYNYGLLLAEIFGFSSSKVSSSSIHESSLLAFRPNNMMLSNQKLVGQLGIDLGCPEDSIVLLKKQYDNGWLSRIKGRALHSKYRFWEVV